MKNNLNYLKSEFSNDEKMIENAFKLEILYKRYKHIIWTLGIFIVAVLLFLTIRTYYIENNALKSSKILNALLENPKDEKLKEELKKSNTNLYSLFVFKEALDSGNVDILDSLSKDSNDLIKYFATYHLASFEQDADLFKGIDKFEMGDFAKIQQAYIFIKENKISQAKEVLDKISENSRLKELSRILLHYTISQQKPQEKQSKDK